MKKLGLPRLRIRIRRAQILATIVLLIIPLLTLAATATPANALTNAGSISVGGKQSCALDAAGKAWCWGQYSSGSFASSTYWYPKTSAVVVAGGLTFSSISVGGSHTCGLTTSGAVYCWGINYYGELGNGTTSSIGTPVLVSGGLTFTSVVAGTNESCGLVGSSAYCWGYNNQGQLGDGTTTNRSVPTAVSGGFNFKQLSVGFLFACGLTTTNNAYCWGANYNGQVGDNTTTNRSVPTATYGALTFNSISSGDNSTCGLVGGSARCWGGNGGGQIGDGTQTNRLAPTVVQGGLAFGSLDVGSGSACGITGTSALYCWGDNVYGDVGDGTTTSRFAPTAVQGAYTWSNVSVGNYLACGTTTAGITKCWGYNDDGSVGTNFSSVLSTTPSPQTNGPAFKAVYGGGWSTTCGLTASGAAYCWGSNNNSQIGDGSNIDRPLPVAVSGGLTFSSLALGLVGTCGLTTTGTAYCWGLYTGDGTGNTRLVPTAVTGGYTFTSLATGNGFSCGIATNANTYCWGLNNHSQLGNGTTTYSPSPVQVSGGLTFTSITAGTYSACGLIAGGSAYCWGWNLYGQLGDGTTTDRSVPTAVTGGVVFKMLNAGDNINCGLSTAGSAYCWGAGGSGAFGSGTAADSSSPVAASGGQTFSTLVVGGVNADHTCAITLTQNLYCWGGNPFGELGNGTQATTNTPQIISSGALSISISSYTTCAVFTGNITKCWGNDDSGALGTSSLTVLTPVDVQFTFANDIASVTIDSTFTFAVAGQSTSCNGESNFNTTAGSPTSVAFGHLTSGGNISGGQSLTVASNAGSGYSVYIRGAQVTQNLRSGTYSWTDVSGTYASPSTLGTGEKFGYTYKDSTSGTAVANPASAAFAALTNTPSAVMSSSSAIAGTGCVSFDAQTAATTPAGTYSATVIYVAIPSF